jgi:hypothetical protein
MSRTLAVAIPSRFVTTMAHFIVTVLAISYKVGGDGRGPWRGPTLLAPPRLCPRRQGTRILLIARIAIICCCGPGCAPSRVRAGCVWGV